MWGAREPRSTRFDMANRLGQPTPSLDWQHHPAAISYPFAARKAAQTGSFFAPGSAVFLDAFYASGLRQLLALRFSRPASIHHDREHHALFGPMVLKNPSR